MTSSFRPSSFCHIVLGLAGGALACTFTGCGIGAFDTADSPSSPTVFTGSVHGGESPIIYSKVSFYETAATGIATSNSSTVSGGVYVPATPLTPLGSTYTDINGNFKFGTALACTNSSDYVYAVASGGNSGAYPGSLNPQILLMAAVSPCTTFGASTSIVVNELTTVAAAYALSGFTSITGSYTTTTAGYANAAAPFTYGTGQIQFQLTGGNQTYNGTFVSGMPFTVSNCTVDTQDGYTVNFNGTYFVSSYSGGVVYAKTSVATPQQDYNCELTPTQVSTVPIVSVTSSATNYATGTVAGTSAAGLAHAMANASDLVSSSDGVAWLSSPKNSNVSVPAALIGSIGNSLQSCVNTATGGSAYNSSLNDGTNCGKLFSYTINTQVVPNLVATNTLQAALNMAHFPTQNVTSIYNLGSGTPAFPLALASAPTDLSMALAFLKGAGGTATTGLLYPYSLALDGNDSVYVLNSNASSTTQSNIVAFQNNGSSLYASAVDTTTITSPRAIAADSLGNLYVTNNASSTTGTGFATYAASSGASESTVANTTLGYLFQVGIDTSNNAWFGYGNVSPAQNLAEYTCNSSGASCASDTLGLTPAGAGYGYQTVPDKYGNIWLAEYNSGTAANPTVLPYSSGYTTGVVTASGQTEKSGYGIIVDSAGNGWYDGATEIDKLAPTYSGSHAITAVVGSVAAASAGTSLRYLAIDGNNTVWAEDNNGASSDEVGYRTTASTPALFKLAPCIINTPSPCPTPSSSTPGIYGPRITAVDSSGDLWVVSSTNGEVIEIIGTAAPSWPLLQAAKYGLMP